MMDLVRPQWPPLRHVQAGWDALTDGERAAVENRLEEVMAQTQLPTHIPREALLRFFGFLAQVETIAIEIPLRFLDHCPDDVRPMLRRQLVDEVFHSVLFARLAHDLAYPQMGPPAPLASAEKLLQQVREEEDLGITATLLNLAAEGWIETLFRHARKWGVADAAFQAVLEDEARHVHEATDYTQDLDLEKARAALERMEAGLLEVGAEPSVALAMVRIAGIDGYRALTRDLHKSHIRHLAVVGLTPGKPWTDTVQALEQTLDEAESAPQPSVVPDTSWTKAARRIWDAPRSPTMQGSFDVLTGHVPRKLLTPIMVAAVGRAWAKHPELNRVLIQDRIYQLPRVNVGVRVKLPDGDLGTVLVTDADTRSVRDIQKLIVDGVQQLQAVRARQPTDAEAPPLDPEMGAWAPPTEAHFAVAISNVGRFGLVQGAGALTGNLSPSTDLFIGQVRRIPSFINGFLTKGLTVGALQDHRVFDGEAAGTAMQAIMDQLRPKAVKAIRKAPDTITQEMPTYDDAFFAAMPASLRALPMVGISKYAPIAIGGAAIGTGLAVGGYFLYQALAGGAAAGGAAAGGAAGAAAGADGAAGTGQQSGWNVVEGEAADGEAGSEAATHGMCQATKKDGSPCSFKARDRSSFCGRHG